MKKTSKNKLKNREGIAYILIIVVCLIVMLTTIIVPIVMINVETITWEETMGIAMMDIVSVAITVWVGLNIYNNLKETEIEKKLLELKLENEALNNRLRYGNFLQKLKETSNQYEVSKFLYDLFQEKVLHDEIEDELLEKLYLIEENFVWTTTAYENSKFIECAKYAERSYEILEGIHRCYWYEWGEEIEFYLKIRKSDIAYYRCYSDKIKPDVKAELYKDSIELYLLCIKYIEKYYEKKAFREKEKNELLGYMYNSLAFTVVRMNNDKLNTDMNHEEVEQWFINSTKYNKKGRYLQNWGSYYEKNLKDYTNAKEKYLQAIRLENKNARDDKCYNLLGSLYLTIFENDNRINKRFEKENSFLLCDREFEDADNYVGEAVHLLKVSIALRPNLINAYFNLAKAYAYKWLMSKDKIFLQLAYDYIAIAKYMDEESKGFLFTKRNIYEMQGDIESALEVNEKIKAGDSENAKRCYEQRLKSNSRFPRKSILRKFFTSCR